MSITVCLLLLHHEWTVLHKCVDSPAFMCGQSCISVWHILRAVLSYSVAHPARCSELLCGPSCALF